MRCKTMKVRVQHGKVVFGEYVGSRLVRPAEETVPFSILFLYVQNKVYRWRLGMHRNTIHSWIQCHHRVGSVITDTPFGNMDGRSFPFMYILWWFSLFIPYLARFLSHAVYGAADLQLNSCAAIRNWFQFARCSVAVHLQGPYLVICANNSRVKGRSTIIHREMPISTCIRFLVSH